MHFSFKNGHKHIYSLFPLNWDWRNRFNGEKGCKGESFNPTAFHQHCSLITLMSFLLSSERWVFDTSHTGYCLAADPHLHSSHHWWSWGIIFDRDWVWPTAWWRQAAASFLWGSPFCSRKWWNRWAFPEPSRSSASSCWFSRCWLLPSNRSCPVGCARCQAWEWTEAPRPAWSRRAGGRRACPKSGSTLTCECSVCWPIGFGRSALPQQCWDTSFHMCTWWVVLWDCVMSLLVLLSVGILFDNILN